ncbi:hypothetical protein OTC26_006570 [Streptomyces tirandamycinicus]|uniref:hypothetical protein n=1 Tax=Streptomyces tirandamycinicus TaxID=2174846 RepID=UPI00226D762E|nr:hypothetical protein [Streptomyces tirandamycinicus]MCY0983879.1 hypothetical protein [Streptomyces tirandamycinicus]
MAKWGRSAADVFWSVDRALGGQRAPTRPQRWAARHPIALGLYASAAFALFLLGVSPGEGLTDVLIALLGGAVGGLLFSLTAMAERGRQRRLKRLGLWNGPGRHASSGRRRATHAARAALTRVRWPLLGAWAAWWALLTAVLWLLGLVTGQPADLPGCAAFALLVIILGEIGDRLRRRRAARRTGVPTNAGE